MTENFFESIYVPRPKCVSQHKKTVALWRWLCQQDVNKLFVVQDEKKKKNGKVVQIQKELNGIYSVHKILLQTLFAVKKGRLTEMNLQGI